MAAGCVKSHRPVFPPPRPTFAGIAVEPRPVAPLPRGRPSPSREWPLSHRLVVRTSRIALLLAALLPTGAHAAPAAAALPPAAPETRLRYGVSLAGIPIARADLTLATTGDHYSSHLTWRTSGIVDVFAAARGDVAASGQLGTRRPAPAIYTLASGEGRKAAKVMLAMAGGSVKSAEVSPPSRQTPDLVPLEPRHRIDVLDPLSATLISAKGGQVDGSDLCKRTLSIFDGWTRYDIRLSPKGTLPNKRAGVTGPIIVCAARYVPVAGHRAEHKVTRFMTDNEDLSVTFGRLEKADVWVPLQVSVRTLAGTAEVEIETIAANGFDKPAAAKPATSPAAATP